MTPKKKKRVPKGQLPELVKGAIEALGVEATNAELADWIKKEHGYEVTLSGISANKPKNTLPTPYDLTEVRPHLAEAERILALIDRLGLPKLRACVQFWKDNLGE